ncbi:MAG: 16S rRNA (cytosine(1402)-N(4))-methyltransferase RsmH [Lachnospiraceae bacterium]|nr:16S rRNA (cytosine(1402)-N(4))-methyltransferase RsmH [Lachnospiraceae bacterium]MCI5587438.1 16S rRNA (cytosine(1402)-N(4))-methyltransferase RsmH [Lachnospiraceae bacterium]
MEFVHKSVLLDEVIDNLNIKPDGIYVDGTLGGAGHGKEVCKRLSANGRFIGIDQDEDAIRASTERLSEFGDIVTIVRSNYSDMVSVLHDLCIDKVDGITLDLGVSSFQLDTADRGFSYRMDAPLDMRMDNRQELSAATVVNEYTESELFHIIKNYGEDKFAKNIAKNIVIERKKNPILTTGRLAEIVDRSIPMKMKKQGGHPAKRTFQAIRIEVNHELDVLQQNLSDMIDLLNPGGRFCIITFHSLEDRIVKKAFREAENPCICPPDFPVCVCGRVSKGRMFPRKPILPSDCEMEANPRSKSAKLRVFQRI